MVGLVMDAHAGAVGEVPAVDKLDARGAQISGANAAAAQAYERALAAFQCWRNGAEELAGSALQHAPGFVMAHVLRAWLLLCSRDPVRARAARPVLATAAVLRANERERMHLAAMSAASADDYELAKTRLGELLRRYPHDILALQVVHAFDYLSGDMEHMRNRVRSVLPAWSRNLPGYHAVLAMHAFSLEECGDYEAAEDTARAAIALNPFDARAHHTMAHVFEMTARPAAGMRWMDEHLGAWGVDTMVATHCWWHMALYRLASAQPEAALRLFDERIRAGFSLAVADLIDASALLWRIHLLGVDTGSRWDELASAWEPHIDDAFCSFNDLHAMLAFVGAGDGRRIAWLERSQLQHRSQATRYGATTRQFGLAACQALAAFGRGENERALILLAALPAVAHRFGGSHAQRDVLYLTLLAAVERMRRGGSRHHNGKALAALAG